MADLATMALSGHKKLQREFRRLSGATQRRIVRRPLAAALTPITKEAKRRVPVKTGSLKKSIGKVVKMFRGAVWGGVGPRADGKFTYTDEQGNRHIPANYAHLVEFGTEETRPQPFLRSAFDATRAISLRILTTGIISNLNKEIAKAKK